MGLWSIEVSGDSRRVYSLVLSSLLTFSVVILCATGSKTMALPLLVLPSDFGSKGGIESLDMGTVEDDEVKNEKVLRFVWQDYLARSDCWR